LRGQKLKIFDCELVVGNVSAMPGEIIKSSEEGIIVAGKGGSLIIKRVQPQDQPKLSASEYVLLVGLRTRERLG
jgi:methionyl-tRNA formyltransferase